VCQLQPAPAAGTLLVKDGSHSAHERFFQTACVLPPEERTQVKDWCAWSWLRFCHTCCGQRLRSAAQACP